MLPHDRHNRPPSAVFPPVAVIRGPFSDDARAVLSGNTQPDPGLLLAGLRAHRAEVLGEIIEQSLAKMAENRARRAREREEQERLEDRVRAHARREKADAESLARADERRRASLERRAAAGDEDAGLAADRAEASAARSRLAARRAEVDFVA